MIDNVFHFANFHLTIDTEFIDKKMQFQNLIEAPIYYLKQGGSCTVWADDNWVVKRYNQKSTWVTIKQNLRLGRAKKVYQQTQQLITDNIATPKTVAHGYVSQANWRLYELIITERLAGITLFELMEDSTLSNNTKRHAILHSIQTLKKLWQAGWQHGDLKAQNIIIADNMAHLIDLDSLCKTTNQQQDKSRFLRNFQQYDSFKPFYNEARNALEANNEIP